MLVAICDDTRADAEKIRFSLMDITDDLETVWFKSGTDLVKSIKSGVYYSLVFQDIYLGKESGMDTALAVRKYSPDTQIIFITTSIEHAVEAFKVQAADYLVKPCSEMEIVKAFARINMKINKPETPPVVLNAGKEIHVFYHDKVIKLESDLHYTVIYQQNTKSTRVHINFADAAELFGKRFIEVRRGLLVNPSYIERLSSSEVILTDGSSYKLPRAKKDTIVARYTEFLTKGLTQ